VNKTILIEEIKNKHKGEIKTISKELNIITLKCGCKYEWNNYYNLYAMNVNFKCPHLKEDGENGKYHDN
jgi:hypothetical protein